jgi:hypothetical protein
MVMLLGTHKKELIQCREDKRPQHPESPCTNGRCRHVGVIVVCDGSAYLGVRRVVVYENHVGDGALARARSKRTELSMFSVKIRVEVRRGLESVDHAASRTCAPLIKI